MHGVVGARAAERAQAGGTLVEDDPDGVDVARHGDSLGAAQLLGRHVARGPEHVVGLGQFERLESSRNNFEVQMSTLGMRRPR